MKTEEDGLITPEVGTWAENKYKHVEYYADLFTKSMRDKWECLVYVDLFSGAGKAKIKDTNKIIDALPLRVLKLPVKFDKYIFCDKDKKKTEALTHRVEKYSSNNITIINGDTNYEVNNCLTKIPLHSKDKKVLCFCVVDIFAVSNLKFSTLELLSERFVDFLVLIPSMMDANRFLFQYIKPDSNIMAEFLGDDEWRKEWAEINNKITFGHFLVTKFGKQMKKLRYHDCKIEDTVLIRSDDNNLPLYHLAFYSRSLLGVKFWKQAKKYVNRQTNIFD